MWVSALHSQLINHHHNSGSNNTLAAGLERGNPRSLKGELILMDTCWRRRQAWIQRDISAACTTSATAQLYFIRNPKAYCGVDVQKWRLAQLHQSFNAEHPSIDRSVYSLVTLNNIRSLHLHTELYYAHRQRFPSCQAQCLGQSVFFHQINSSKLYMEIGLDVNKKEGEGCLVGSWSLNHSKAEANYSFLNYFCWLIYQLWNTD